MPYDVEVRLTLARGETVLLRATCEVSGCYRPAKISGDPDTCYEAEHPEVETSSIVLLVREDAEGTETELEELEKFDRKALSADEDRKLESAIYAAALDTERSVYEDELERRGDIAREDD